MHYSNELLSVNDAADALGVTKQTVTRLIRLNRLAAQKIGGTWVIPANVLKSYFQENDLVPEPKDHPRKATRRYDIAALSFFSGALGLDLGMERAGIHPVLFCENDRKCRMTIDSARPEAALIGDITRYSADDVLSLTGLERGKVDIMFGGPPCQAFSTAGARRAFDDARGNVFLKYLDLAAEIKPTYVVIENVRGLLSTPFPVEKDAPPVKGGALTLILKKLKQAGYAVSFNLYNAANFGAAQIRERVVIIGKQGSEEVPHLAPTHSDDSIWGLPAWRTFGDAVSDLDEENMHHIEFPEKRLKYFRMLKEGQCWRHLPLSLQEEAMGKSFTLSGGKTGFYRRISFDRPCPTLVTSPTMPATDLCHPTKDRPLSVEEYKRVQGFPDDWPICGNILDKYRQIGNAVPTALGEAIGRAIIDDMNGVKPQKRFAEFKYSRYRRTSEETWSC
ncbi:DNA cytosine methyltransferase [Gordonibacter sp. RACS_AR68]|uniref:DNA cytosine methyltransferase n=1 Tax=Gordonibacter sp. RACS_AR68 TaxID=2872005 RepID=UPI0026246647|nr:DNA cytosine methyltransferase [Gordonibacter sp. RACS_AR68]MDN4469433.1 DNA cytosine methyltransferase [Gordonibacter sp. RACS_AR68]